MRRGQTERLFAWAARQKRKIGLIKMVEENIFRSNSFFTRTCIYVNGYLFVDTQAGR